MYTGRPCVHGQQVMGEQPWVHEDVGTDGERAFQVEETTVLKPPTWQPGGFQKIRRAECSRRGTRGTRTAGAAGGNSRDGRAGLE